MKYYIITPVGTSLIRSNQPNKTILSEMRARNSDDDIVRKNIEKHKKHFLSAITENPNKSCAEINSISLFMENYSKDKKPTISLLPTDTAESYLASIIISEYFESQGFIVKKQIIKKLSYSDPKLFRREGLKNLIEKVKSEILTAKQTNCIPIINATAGFKAESAILLLLAQLLGLDIFYAHELMRNDLVLFPKLPVTLDPMFWNSWKPIIQAVLDSNNTNAGIMQINQFYKLAKYLDLDQGRILFDIDEDFGGVTLSTMGLLLVNSLNVQISDIVLPESTVDINKRINLNESEMPHAPRGSRAFIEKVKQLSFIKNVRNEKFVSTIYSRVKPKYDNRDPNEVRIVFSDGTKGLELVVLTTAKNEAENYQAKRLLAEHLNIPSNSEISDESSHLFLPGELLDDQFTEVISSLAEKIEKAEEIIQQGHEIIQPYINNAERERTKAKQHRKEKEKVERQLEKARKRICELEDMAMDESTD